jgi:hypothetical protein
MGSSDEKRYEALTNEPLLRRERRRRRRRASSKKSREF